MSTGNDINELREHLFATLRGLRDKDNPMDIDRARAVSQVASVVIDSARVEVEMSKVTGEETASGFIPTNKVGTTLPPGITGITQHRLKG